METYNLTATTRTQAGKANQLRSKGQVPAVLYGPKIESKPLAFDGKELKRVFNQAGTSALVDLTIDEAKPIKVLLQEPQFHYLNGELSHIDCYAVRMDEKLETSIPLVLVGVAPAVEELEGSLVQSKDELDVRCLPTDLIPEIEVDISVLKTFDDSIRVSDLRLPSTLEVLHDPEEVVVSVSEPISKEELAELEEDTSEKEAAAVEELGKETQDESPQEKEDES